MLNNREKPSGARSHQWERKAATVYRCKPCGLECVTEGKPPPPEFDGGCRPKVAAGEHCWHPDGTQYTCCRCRAARSNAEAAGLFGCAVETDACNGERIGAGGNKP